MNKRIVRYVCTLVGTVWPAGLMVCAGCHLMVNPFEDELSGQPPVTTPSAMAARAVQGQASPLQRPFAQTQVNAKDGTVTHGPLLFEDAFEEIEGTDNTFAWTGEDYLGWFGGGGRFLINTALYPISAVVTPPWKTMASDGHPEPRVFGSEHHDSATSTASGLGSTFGGHPVEELGPPTQQPSHASTQNGAVPRSTGASG